MNGDENENHDNDILDQSEINNEIINKIDSSDIDMDIFIPNNKNDTIYFASEFGTNESKKQSYTYSFEYYDNLINIGPCGYGIVSEGDSDEIRLLQRHIPPQYQTTPLDFVTTSGTNKSASVSILQQTIKPELITTQALPGSIDMWTVYSSINNNNNNNLEEQKREHSFILIGQETSTLIFQTGIDITELEQGGFITNEQTIYCGNITDEYIVQVTRLHIVLLRHSTQLQIISYENNPIRFATSLENYLAILTTHGVIYIYSLKQELNEQQQVKLIEYFKLDDKKYTCINLYIDHSGLFTTTPINNLYYSHSNSPKKETKQQQQSTILPLTTNPLDSHEFPSGDDDEDEWLYGGKTLENSLPSSTKIEPMDNSNNSTITNSLPIITKPTNIPITRWLIAISKDGTLTMHELMLDEINDVTIKFEIVRFNNGLKILVDIQDTIPPMTHYLGKIDTSCSAFVYELLIIGLGPKKDRVYLIVSF